MSVCKPNIQLSALHQELERGCFDLLDLLQESDDLNWWSLIYDTPQTGHFHRQIIYQLVGHRKFDALDAALELTQLNFHYTHWLLVLLETLHAKIPSLDKLKATASRHLKLISPSQVSIITRILKILIIDCEPRDMIVFFDYLKTVCNIRYITFRTQLLKEVRLWIECQSRLPSDHLIASFHHKWEGAIEAIEYVRKMYKEEQDSEVTFYDVFHQLSASTEQRRLIAHTEYVVTELVLTDHLSSDILKHILRLYLV